jgi:hypothetical protein
MTATDEFVRSPNDFTDRITGDRSSGWPAEPGRYSTPHRREALGGRPFRDGTPPGPPPADEAVPPPL